MQTKSIERYFFFGLLLLTLVFTFFVFKPFWVVLVLGSSFAIVLYPIHHWLINHKIPKSISALITVLFFIVVICGPLFGIGTIIFKQSQNLYSNIANNAQNFTPIYDSINQKIENILPAGISFNLQEKTSYLITLITSNITKIFSTTVNTIFSFILIILAIFYLLKDGEKWKKSLIKLSPLNDTDDSKIVTRLSKTINGVIKGTLLIALAQGFLMGVGLTIFGVPNSALWGVVAGIASLIPSVGTALVSVPIIIFLYFSGNIVGAIGMTVWAAVLVGMIDNLLSPIVVGKKTQIPPFLILFSVLGGISLLGPIGILIGPLTVSLLYTLISIYNNEFKAAKINS